MGMLAMVKNVATGDRAVELQAEIEVLKREGAAACAELDRLEAAKVDADSFDDAQKLEAECGRQRWLIARADKRLPDLERWLGDARAERQKRSLERHHAIAVGIFRKLRKTIEAAAVLQGEAIAARRAAEAEIGGNAVQLGLPIIAFRGLLLPDLVERWAAEMERVLAAKPRSPQRPPAAPAKAQKPLNDRPVFPQPDLQRVARMTRPPDPDEKPLAPREPLVAQDARSGRIEQIPAPRIEDRPLGIGEARTRVIRSGYPDLAGRQCRTGDVLILPARTAVNAERNGAVEIIEESQK